MTKGRSAIRGSGRTVLHRFAPAVYRSPAGSAADPWASQGLFEGKDVDAFRRPSAVAGLGCMPLCKSPGPRCGPQSVTPLLRHSSLIHPLNEHAHRLTASIAPTFEALPCKLRSEYSVVTPPPQLSNARASFAPAPKPAGLVAFQPGLTGAADLASRGGPASSETAHGRPAGHALLQGWTDPVRACRLLCRVTA